MVNFFNLQCQWCQSIQMEQQFNLYDFSFLNSFLILTNIENKFTFTIGIVTNQNDFNQLKIAYTRLQN
jgi:hypothetical protein